MRKLEGLKPERVFYYFEEISKIPRESANEKAVSDYLVDTAKNLGLEYFRDENLNVIIRKKATKGYEKLPGVVLQGHMDMVCEKEIDSNHDFKKDPIDLVVDGEYIRANKTTLGGDNGIAVAMALAVLEDKELQHPDIEFLATTEEETTMNGALSLKPGILKGKMLINIDSEEEGILTAGCAGGLGVTINFKPKKEIIDKTLYNFVRLEVKKLFGGHSGMEINTGKANANKVLNEMLIDLTDKFNLKFFAVNGGSKDNAIPRNCSIDLAVDKNQKSDFDKYLKDLEFKIKNIYKEEKELEIESKNLDAVEEVFSYESLKTFIRLIKDIPTGPNTMMTEYPDIVESSDNLAIIKTVSDEINIIVSLRSSDPKVLKDLANKISNIAEENEATYKLSDGYPEWIYRKNSFLRDKAVEVYKEMFGEEMEITVIHAGLECGAISQAYPDMDMISIGPNMYDVHTPKERMEIASIAKYYDYIKKLLKELK